MCGVRGGGLVVAAGDERKTLEKLAQMQTEREQRLAKLLALRLDKWRADKEAFVKEAVDEWSSARARTAAAAALFPPVRCAPVADLRRNLPNAGAICAICALRRGAMSSSRVCVCVCACCCGVRLCCWQASRR